MRILVIAAHPDDEVLGMGATIKKLSKKNHKIHLCVVSEGASAQYSDKKMIKIRKDACVKAGKVLGITQFTFLGFPDAKLDTTPQLEINKELERIIAKFKPEIVYTTPSHDLMKDHLKVHDCTLVATRPISNIVKQVICYEIPGITKIPFHPNIYEKIEKEFSYKKKAFQIYKSEVMKFPHPRSIKSIENLSIQRGIESGLKKAEAFQLIRHILDK